MIEMKEEQERAILVAVDTGEYDAAVSLDELEELAQTAGAVVLGKISQKRPAVDKTTCVGSGMLEQIKNQAAALGANLLIFDHELTASQLRNIEEATDLAVVDRTTLILDIFAQRARSREGKLQVELAQQKYRLPRLMGQGTALSRLGGGIGTRGPGESKLESDRRHIRRRIESLEEQLRDLERQRSTRRARRKKDGVITVAIVGYTNVGKSTLLNTLTNAGVLAEDKLFATLDPTARALTLPDGRTIMLIDTVGLVRRLPHQLVEAFQSTLEEAADADLLLHVCDISSPEADDQIEVTRRLLDELGCTGTPVVTALNKCDQLESMPVIMGSGTVLISARTGYGLNRLLEAMAKALPPSQLRMRLLLPYEKAALAAEIRESGKIFSEEYTPDGLLLDALVSTRISWKLEDFQADG
ncbi:MAG: GTPase HflX [Oscillospiraceae bacterium]|nr:GTPase HflX [Oscillospiraceae bacterium]MDD7040749.1 GTPase HflX [Oscillospiraceae bacterium]MDY2612117.1 GTPase HflX [Oscillospiraceae bacterium]